MNRLFRIAKLIGINASVLFLFLLFVEGCLRLLNKDFGNSPTDADQLVNWVHPSNYHYNMFTPSGEFGGFTIYFDSLGRRAQAPEFAQKHMANAPSFVFLGDSFTEALQVSFDSSFVGTLAARYPDASFLNYGVTGYGTILYYLQCKKMLEKHGVRPTAVFMSLYSNDVRDDSTVMPRAIYNSNHSEIIAVNGGKKNGLVALLRKSYLVRSLNKIYQQWKFSANLKNGEQNKGVLVHTLFEEAPEIENTLSAEYILKTDSLLKSRNIPFYVSAIPSRYKNFTRDGSRELFPEKAEKWSREHNLSFINLQKVFDSVYQKHTMAFFYSMDVHCNASGHKVMAEAFSPVIRKYLP